MNHRFDRLFWPVLRRDPAEHVKRTHHMADRRRARDETSGSSGEVMVRRGPGRRAAKDDVRLRLGSRTGGGYRDGPRRYGGHCQVAEGGEEENHRQNEFRAAPETEEAHARFEGQEGDGGDSASGFGGHEC